MREKTKKERIIEAARSLFVKHGFAGTSIGKIAKLAEINTSLIFHHFKTKENLWQEIKQRISNDNNQNFKVLPDTNLPFDKFLRELFYNCIKFYRKNPDIIRMISWQRLEYKNNKEIGIAFSDRYTDWISAFEYYQKTGELNINLKVECVITMILSISNSTALDNNTCIDNLFTEKEYINFCVDSLQKAFIPKTK
jgi:AcrR family transcriptional regulator